MSYREALSKQPNKQKIKEKLDKKLKPRVQIEASGAIFNGSIQEIINSENGANWDKYKIILDTGVSIEVHLTQIKTFI